VTARPNQGGLGLAPVPVAGEEAEAQADLGRWLTLTELAAQTGRRLEGVRSWAKRGARAGRIRTRKNNRGEVQVWATAEVLAELEPEETSVDQVADLGHQEEVAELRLALTEAATRAARAEGELAAEQRRNTELRADLTAALAKAETRADRLEAALAEARRPWLAKVIEGLRRR
jgi:hypothetical protein